VFVKGVDESIASLLSSNRTQSVDEAQAIVIAGLDLVEELKKGIEHGKPVIIDPTVEQMALLNGLMVSFDDHPFILIHSWIFDRVQVFFDSFAFYCFSHFHRQPWAYFLHP